ncbi:(2Fe-2S)-binding protein [Histidinibacterium lentulum]|uniref:(2Fe-2S)-binding protein n=1 Tax=Histidinibacterium lentulum TaxID=2480588 RepID=A0A3N2QRZ1_9RHOB|nr:(2Fe-2S)-binding protein [Histidinibacterium lentulum]ROT97983.1 (2Fe-2S)-binding protein [Histidinibacterium lentulum]
MTLSFTVNGRAVSLDPTPDRPLLTALRENLGLKSARFGCGAESCGACTVLVDGVPRFACTLPVSDIDGRDIATAEGLETPEGDHPLLEAMLAHQAAQCGYCLPGILMRARAYLDAGGRADRAAIAEALDANLCRCGAHPRILDAVMDAARRMGTAA